MKLDINCGRPISTLENAQILAKMPRMWNHPKSTRHLDNL